MLLYKDEEIVGIYDNAEQAINTAIKEKQFKLETFLVQKIEKQQTHYIYRVALILNSFKRNFRCDFLRFTRIQRETEGKAGKKAWRVVVNVTEFLQYFLFYVFFRAAVGNTFSLSI